MKYSSASWCTASCLCSEGRYFSTLFFMHFLSLMGAAFGLNACNTDTIHDLKIKTRSPQDLCTSLPQALLCRTAALMPRVSTRDPPGLASWCITPHLCPKSRKSCRSNMWQRLASVVLSCKSSANTGSQSFTSFVAATSPQCCEDIASLKKYRDIYYRGRLEKWRQKAESKKLSVEGVYTFGKYNLNTWNGKSVKFFLGQLPFFFLNSV